MKWEGGIPVWLPAATFIFCTSWMFLAGFTDPGSIPVSDEQRAGRAAAEAENHVRQPPHVLRNSQIPLHTPLLYAFLAAAVSPAVDGCQA